MSSTAPTPINDQNNNDDRNRTQIAEKMGISVAKMERWSANRSEGGCPLLGGNRVPPVRKAEGIHYKPKVLQIVIDQVNKVPRNGEHVDEEGNKYLEATETKNRYGYSLPNLNKWRTQGCPWLPGRRKIKADKFVIWQKRRDSRGTLDGTFRKRPCYLEKDLDIIAVALMLVGVDPKWRTGEELEQDERYGFPASTYRFWSGRKKHKHYPHPEDYPCLEGLGGRWVHSREGHRITNGNPRPVIEYSRDDLDKIVETKAALKEAREARRGASKSDSPTPATIPPTEDGIADVTSPAVPTATNLPDRANTEADARKSPLPRLPVRITSPDLARILGLPEARVESALRRFRIQTPRLLRRNRKPTCE